jgi:CPA1 family monovalent cation:H+ antiporter
VVVFLVILEVQRAGDVSAFQVGKLFVTEALGGAGFGIIIGLFGYYLLRRINHYKLEVLITVATATGVYALAEVLHFSAPIAVVAAGLLIGNHGRMLAMSDETRQNLDTFWELIDDILNAVLFLLIGLEMIVIPMGRPMLLTIACIIPVVLFARWASVSSVMLPMRRFRKLGRGTIWIVTWAGLRGGISIALALSLSQDIHRQLLVPMTYGVVVFSIVVQGLTIGPVIRHFFPPEQAAA